MEGFWQIHLSEARPISTLHRADQDRFMYLVVVSFCKQIYQYNLQQSMHSVLVLPPFSPDIDRALWIWVLV
jgi:hypothetical protein